LQEAAIPNANLIENAVRTIAQELGFTTDMAAAITYNNMDMVIGREEEIRRVLCILSQPTNKHNVLLIGESGVGKTAIIRGLAQRIAVFNVPGHFMNYKLLSLDIGALITNTERGEVEGRLKRVLNDITQSPGTIILCVEEIRLLMGASDVDATHLLWSILSCSQLYCIGTTTPFQYDNCIGTDGGLFEQFFHQIMIKELSIPETITILRSRKEKYERDHGVTILDSALRTSATLSARYSVRRLPASAIDLIGEAAAAIQIAHRSQPEIIEALMHKLCQLYIDINALKKETDEDSRLLLAQDANACEQCLGREGGAHKGATAGKEAPRGTRLC
jgi:ATP-dependent Clp protease ATP-binding subunit ClpB